MEEIESIKRTFNLIRQKTAGRVDSLLLEKEFISYLESCGPTLYFVPIQYTTQQELYRMVINEGIVGKNKRIKNIKDLKYPPEDKVLKYGRCNLPHQSVFYGTFDFVTLISEVQPKIGDLVTVSTWVPKENKELIVCVIFKNQPIGFTNPRTKQIAQSFENNLSQYTIEEREKINNLLQAITDEFSKPVDLDHLEYISSAFYSDKALNAVGNDAILYPSVEQGLNFENIAIKPNKFDLNYRIKEVYDGIINNSPQNGIPGTITDCLNFCTDIDILTGDINWGNEGVAWSPEKKSYYKSQFGLDVESL